MPRLASFISLVALCSTAHADHVLATAGAESGTTGTTAAAGIEVVLGDVALALRGDGERRATFLVGLAPRDVATTRWRPRCASDCATARDPIADVTVQRRVVPLAGVRQHDMQTSAIVAARIHPSTDILGDRIEVALTGVVAGRDREFVQHARYMPGWYLAAAWRIGPVEVGGEVGATGLETRTMDGAIHTDAYALATLGLAVSR